LLKTAGKRLTDLLQSGQSRKAAGEAQAVFAKGRNHFK